MYYSNLLILVMSGCSHVCYVCGATSCFSLFFVYRQRSSQIFTRATFFICMSHIFWVNKH